MRFFRLFSQRAIFLAILVRGILAMPTRAHHSDGGSGSVAVTVSGHARDYQADPEDARGKLGGIPTLDLVGPESGLSVEPTSPNLSCDLRSRPEVCSVDPSPTLTERAGLIPPSFFYKGGVFKRRCLPPELVVTRTKADNHLGYPIGQWPDWLGPDYPGGRNAALVRIASKQGNCKTYCDCSEDGRLTRQRRAVPAPPKNPLCQLRQFAERCAIMFGCFCEAELIQPSPTATGIPLDEYQNALDRIPKIVKLRNPDYKWNHGAGELTFSKKERQVGGTAEPYYVEGPSSEPGWDWLAKLNAGHSFGGLSGGFSGLSKRESKADADPKLVEAGDSMDLEDRAVLTESPGHAS
ncbi:hypothetical protein TWF696_003663 [Orbilia brochopaga]|uniref:Uncharacterized protein n=1 Tax=Orbilia brochopaga TaxID=3140254 RepID=A0AAV9V657_9PEZI